MVTNLVAFPLGFWWRAPLGLIVVRHGRGVQGAPADESTRGGASRTRKRQKPRSSSMPRKSTVRDLLISVLTARTKPGARNAPHQLRLPSQRPLAAPRAISSRVRSDKARNPTCFESRHSTTRRHGAALAPRDARRDGARPRPARHDGAGPHEAVRVRPERSGPAPKSNFAARYFRPRPHRGLHAVDAAPARRRGAAVL